MSYLGTYQLENSSVNLVNTHDPELCRGRPCCVHNKTRHHMRSWRQHWRSDRGIMERICPFHGHGCPDPDQFSYWQQDDRMFESVHGCMKSPYNVMKCCSPWKLYGSSAAVIPGYGGRYTITMDGRVWAFDRSLDSSDAGSPFFEVPSQMNEDISTVELTTESGRLVQVSVSDLDVLAFGSPTELDEVLSIV